MSVLMCLGTFFGLVFTAAPVEEPELTKEEKNIVTETNKVRAKADLPPLKIHPLLCKAAKGHARNLAKQDVLVHDLDGENPGDRILKAGYKFHTWRENVCRGQKNAAQAVSDWMQSPTHSANILGTDSTEIGVAIAIDAKKRKYYVQVFASPKQP
jgi:uncharacterized protein YkwD